MPNLTTWLGNGIAGREADTAREIAADPTTVAVRRNNATLPGTVTVRIVAGNRDARLTRGAASESVAGAVTILAAAGADLRRGDLLQAPGGVIYRVTFVYPEQNWRLEAAAEVV
jgi:hypothetical protein